VLLQRQDGEVVAFPLALVEGGAVVVGVAEHGEARRHALDCGIWKLALRPPTMKESRVFSSMMWVPWRARALIGSVVQG